MLCKDLHNKGKVERVFRSIKQQWLYGLDIASVVSLEDFNRRLDEFVRNYNLTKHSATDETPMNRYLQTRERIKTPASYEWLADCFLHRDRRKVRNDATVRIDNLQYDAPMQFIGQTVDLRFLPGKTDSAFILFDHKHYPLRLTNKVENARTKRHTVSIDYARQAGCDHV